MQWFTYCVVFIAGALLAAGVCTLAESDPNPATLPLRQSDVNPSTTYAFIDPLLGVRNLTEDTSPEFAALESTIRDYISKQERAGVVDVVSVKVRDLQSSTGFTINPDERYAPASLLKVPTMMTYFKLAEANSTLLNKRLTYGGSTDTRMPVFTPTQPLVAGRSYTITELIERMIRYSDNEALILLEQHLAAIGQSEAYETVTRDLGIENVHAAGDFITIQGYGLFWRVLYNATYLNRTMSEEALRILSTTDYTGGIPAGVPDDLTVAHKFGEYGLLELGTGKVLKAELHDCGVVYYPARPYLLCIMTKGDNITALDRIITDISRMAYQDRVQARQQ